MLAATNRPEVFDPALLRPGRFDRQSPYSDRPGARAVCERAPPDLLDDGGLVGVRLVACPGGLPDIAELLFGTSRTRQ